MKGIPATAARREIVAAGALALLAVALTPHAAEAACGAASSPSSRPAKPPVVLDVLPDDPRAAACPSRPRTDCERARASRLVVRDAAKNDEDRLLWRWNGESRLEPNELPDPAAGATFHVCIYDSHDGSPFLIASVRVPPGRSWRRDVAGGWSYLASRNGPSGVTGVRLTNGEAGRAILRVEAVGQLAPLPQRASRARFFHQDREVVVQLAASTADQCWTSGFASAATNSAQAFRTSIPPKKTTGER